MWQRLEQQQHSGGSRLVSSLDTNRFYKGLLSKAFCTHTHDLEVVLTFVWNSLGFLFIQGIYIASDKSSSFYKAGESEMLFSEKDCFAWMTLLVSSELWGLEREQRSLVFFIDMHKFRHMQFRIGSWIESELCPYSDNKISYQVVKL